MIRLANVDPNQIDREFFGDYMKYKGYSCDLFNSGSSLLDFLQTSGIYYDVIILDWDLSDLSCLSLIEFLRGFQIGLVIVSHKNLDHQIASNCCYRVYDRDVFFFEKPINFTTLIDFARHKTIS